MRRKVFFNSELNLIESQRITLQKSTSIKIISYSAEKIDASDKPMVGLAGCIPLKIAGSILNNKIGRQKHRPLRIAAFISVWIINLVRVIIMQWNDRERNQGGAALRKILCTTLL